MVSNWSRMKIMGTAFPIMGTLVLSILLGRGFGIEPNMAFLLPFSGVVGFGIGRLFLRSYFKKQKELVKGVFASIGKKLQSSQPEIAIDNGFELDEIEVKNSQKTRS